MEKAWAKIHGSYDLIISGDGATTLRDITGAPSFNYETKDDETLEIIENHRTTKKHWTSFRIQWIEIDKTAENHWKS